MLQQRYGFIVKTPDMDFLAHQGRLKSEQFEIAVCAVRTVEEAVMVAQELLTRHVQVIELSGGFDARDAEQVSQALQGRARVGLVQYLDAPPLSAVG